MSNPCSTCAHCYQRRGVPHNYCGKEIVPEDRCEAARSEAGACGPRGKHHMKEPTYE